MLLFQSQAYLHARNPKPATIEFFHADDLRKGDQLSLLQMPNRPVSQDAATNASANIR